MRNEHILPIVSGGIDSTVMLYFLHENNYKITEVLSFNYGQKHQKEIKHAQQVISKFKQSFGYVDLHHRLVDMQNIGDIISYGALTGSEELPKVMYDDESQKITVVPNRNMIFLSIAAGRAVTINASYIGYAAHASDYAVYPDCRPEFIDALDKAIALGNLWDPVNLIAPFQHLTKIEIVKLGIDLNVPMELTWSCYKGDLRPCLECGTCLERTEAFMKNNIEDPALNKTEWTEAVEKYNQIKEMNKSRPN